jgi:alcohol dehydrogenase YqhD (iron-dependent ADH family)
MRRPALNELTQLFEIEAVSLYLLPKSCREMLDVIPLEAVFAFVAQYGGTVLYFNEKDDEFNQLVQILGQDTAQKLVSHYRGESLEIPRLHDLSIHIRNQDIVKQHAEGMAVNTLARTHKITRRQVFRILKQARSAK